MKKVIYLRLAVFMLLLLTVESSRATTTRFLTESVASIKANGTFVFCMEDNSGYMWSVIATKNGERHWTFSGTVNVHEDFLWIVSGEADLNQKRVELTATNPGTSSCPGPVASFTYVGRVKDTAMSGGWSNTCHHFGTWAGIFQAGETCNSEKPSVNSHVPVVINLDSPTGVEKSKTIENKDPTSVDKQITVKVYPDPAKANVTINYTLQHDDEVNIGVYNQVGQIVKTLVNEQEPPGTFTINWNITNEGGMPVNNGIYFLRIQTKSGVQSQAFSIIK